jgi:hypothetical protein
VDEELPYLTANAATVPLPQVPSGEWEEGAAPQYAPEVSEYACAGGAHVLRNSRCLPSVEAAVRTLARPSPTNIRWQLLPPRPNLLAHRCPFTLD